MLRNLQQNAEAVGIFCQSSVMDGEPDVSLRAVLSRMKAVAVNNAPINSDIHPMSYKPSADNVIWEATTAAAQNCEQVTGGDHAHPIPSHPMPRRAPRQHVATRRNPFL